MVVTAFLFFGVVTVDGIEFESSLATKRYCFIEESSFADGPQNELVTFFLQLDQGIDGEGKFRTDGRVFVFDDGTVKIDCYNRNQKFLYIPRKSNSFFPNKKTFLPKNLFK